MNILKLKDVLNHINSARLLLTGEPIDGESSEWKVKLVNALIDAENAGLNVWEATRISDGDDKQPLDSNIGIEADGYTNS